MWGWTKKQIQGEGKKNVNEDAYCKYISILKTHLNGCSQFFESPLMFLEKKHCVSFWKI